MKKILGLSVTALLLITLSGCQFNLFAAFDRIEIPTVTDLNAKASSNPDGFVSDVSDYVDNNFLENPDVTSDQEQAVVDNLTAIYNGTITASIGVQQQAAILAGELEITRDPLTSAVVGNVVGAVTDALAAGGTIDPNVLISGIFPSDLDINGLQNILNDLDNAAAAYAVLAPTLAGNDPGMTSGEIGDMAQFAVVALVVSDLRDQLIVSQGSEANADNAILLAIQGGSLPAVTNPLDTTETSTYDDELVQILNFSGLAL